MFNNKQIEEKREFSRMFEGKLSAGDTQELFSTIDYLNHKIAQLLEFSNHKMFCPRRAVFENEVNTSHPDCTCGFEAIKKDRL